jgi:hypothetical protein
LTFPPPDIAPQTHNNQQNKNTKKRESKKQREPMILQNLPEKKKKIYNENETLS